MKVVEEITNILNQFLDEWDVDSDVAVDRGTVIKILCSVMGNRYEMFKRGTCRNYDRIETTPEIEKEILK